MKKLKTIGIYVNLHTSFGTNILHGIARYSRMFGPWAFYLDLIGDLKILIDNKSLFSGIICQVIDESTIAKLRELDLPTVNVSTRMENPQFPSVISDDLAIGVCVAEHFMDRGFRTFGFCGIPDHHYSNVRQEGFTNRLRKAGYDCSVNNENYDRQRNEPWEEMAAWLQQLPKPVAIMACNDIRARHVVETCTNAGLRIPEEIALVGVDNDEIQCDLSNMPLSSVDTRADQIGFVAAQQLIKLMKGQKSPRKPLLIPPRGVVTRTSSDILATADHDVAEALKYIRDHAGEPIKVEDVMEGVIASRRSLERRFRQLLRKTPHDAIRQAHVDRAKMLLEETSLPMRKIADNSGFSDARQFSMVFRQAVGMTPTQYRARTKA